MSIGEYIAYSIAELMGSLKIMQYTVGDTHYLGDFLQRCIHILNAY